MSDPRQEFIEAMRTIAKLCAEYPISFGGPLLPKLRRLTIAFADAQTAAVKLLDDPPGLREQNRLDFLRECGLEERDGEGA